MKKFTYIVVLSLFLFAALDVGAVNFGLDRIDDDLKSTADGQNITVTITSIVAYLVGFFYLIALIFGIYAGFLVMTSGGDEERVKKGKNIFIYVIIGLIVVFLASTIIRFVVNSLEGRALGTGGAVSEQTGTMGTSGVSTGTSSGNPTSVQVLDPYTGEVIGEY